MPLKNHVVQALSGESDSLVVFLHGYGADGADLLNLADSLKIHLPNTIFMSPDAPNKSTMNPFGYEWFPIPRLDGSSLENAKKGRDEATKELNLFLNEIKENTGIPFERIFLFGFSQGCMMSLHLAPRKNEKIAGVVGIAGMLMQPELLEKEAVQKPPILLVHGDEDDVVPYEELNIAADTLLKSNFEVYTLTSKGAGHSITEDGLRAALQFIKNIL
tara:strand:+ start:6932 stop:7582 length:651 start_codon:yes stop_codon:yes gene_type:complete